MLGAHRVISSSMDGTLRVWDVENIAEDKKIMGDAGFTAVAATDEGLVVAEDAIGNFWFIKVP